MSHAASPPESIAAPTNATELVLTLTFASAGQNRDAPWSLADLPSALFIVDAFAVPVADFRAGEAASLGPLVGSIRVVPTPAEWKVLKGDVKARETLEKLLEIEQFRRSGPAVRNNLAGALLSNRLATGRMNLPISRSAQ